MKPSPRQLTTAVICLLLAALTWAVFGQTLGHDFINYDDPLYVYENPHISKGVTLEGISWSLTHPHGQNWHPLTSLSHMIDCQIFGLNAGGHHFTNVLLHTIAVLLLFFVLREMTGATWPSAFVAALFAIHPLRAESVAWVAERKDVLSGVFFMLTLGAYVRYVRDPARSRYWAISILFALGLLAKPMIVTLPFVLLLLDYWPLNRFGRARSGKKTWTLRALLLEKWPWFALALASSVTTLLVQQQLIGSTEALPLSARINNAAITYFAYVRDMCWPTHLAPFYPHPENRSEAWQIICAFLALAAITLAALWLRRKRPYFFVGWLWYVAMLLPVIGIIQVGWQARADRYTYLPQVGLYFCVTWGALDLGRARVYRTLAAGAAVVVVLLLACRAWIQTSYWKNNERLWTHTIAVTENNDVAFNNLGVLFLAKGRLNDAIVQFEKAVAIRSQNTAAQGNLAKSLLEQGKIEEAISHYDQVLQIEPENVEARNFLGTIFFRQGKVQEAIAQWRHILATEPDNGNALSNLAWVFATYPDPAIRNGKEALGLAQHAVSISDQRNALLLRTLAAAYAEARLYAEAVEVAERAQRLARDQGNVALADELRAQVRLYQNGTPLRDSANAEPQ